MEGARPYGKLCRMAVRSCLAALAVAGIVVSGCASQPHSAAPAAVQVTAAFKGSPPVLAALHARSNKLVGGGQMAFKALLVSMHGYPVVVNKWASWCGPCQSEFAAFQRAAVAFGRRVAFVGLDGKDNDGAAAAFLRKFPVTYPSYVDPQENIARSIDAATYYPQTLYFDRNGNMVFDHAGAYPNAAALEHDIRRYALAG
jgi:thiol-disulfide isomerase/thioredoxin